MAKILIGIAFIIGGLSGEMVIRGTNSSVGLAILGVGLILWGGYQIYSGKSGGADRAATAKGRAATARRAAEVLKLEPRQTEALVYIYEHNSMTLDDFKRLCPEADSPSLEQDLQAMVKLGLMVPQGDKFVIT